MDIDDVRLGATYRDSATQFCGKATAKTLFLHSKNGEVRLETQTENGHASDLWVRSERLIKALPSAGPTETKG
jgi:hypothetical protein